MEKALETMIKTIVNDTENVSINKVEKENLTVFEVRVSKEDMGKVIGKDGKNAKAIRTILRAIGNKEHKKVTVEFMD